MAGNLSMPFLMSRFPGVLFGFTSRLTGVSRLRNYGRVPATAPYCQKASPQLNPNVTEPTDPTEPPTMDSVVQDMVKDLDPANARKLQLLRLELEMHRQSGYRVPSVMAKEHWNELMQLHSQNQRIKYLRFLGTKEFTKLAEKEKKEKRQKEREIYMSERPQERCMLDYGLSKNTIFLYIRDSSINFIYSCWQAQAMMFGPRLVVDLGFDEHMNRQESNNAGDQLVDMFAANRRCRDPFHLIFCNVKPDSTVMKRFHKTVCNLYEPESMVTITEKSYLDLFPSHKLVYLSPHCKNELSEVDEDKVYIVGGIVDKSIQSPLTLAKGKKERLAMAKFPLDSYLLWGHGQKSLTLDQCMKILLTAKETKDWNEAFKHIPRRKLVRAETSQPRFSPSGFETTGVQARRDRRRLFEDYQ